MLLSKEWDRFLDNWMRVMLTTWLLLREEMYSMAEKECLAVKLGIYVGLGKTVYIANRPSGTTVVGLGKESSVQLTRLSLFLQPYQLELVIWPGNQNRNACLQTPPRVLTVTSLKLEKGKERSKLENFVLMFTVQVTGKVTCTSVRPASL